MKLAKRERFLVSVAAFSLAIFCILQFLVFPFFEKRRRLRRGVSTKEQGLEEILRLGSELRTYQKASQGIQRSLSKRKGFTLFSFLEKAAGEAQVKARIKYMKPSSSSGTGPYKESMVEMKLEAITLQELVGYLYRIESPENLVNIKRISVSQNKKEEGYLDSILQVITFQK